MKYSVIYADPPWDIKGINSKLKPGQEILDYPTMSLEEIRVLPIRDMSLDNSCCFLWTIQSYLPYSFRVLESWGFNYQRTITWDKCTGLCFNGFHHRTEFLLFGYKGKIEIYKSGQQFPTIIKATSKRHSEKPEIFRTLIEPFGEPRIELFARNKYPGWDVWGNEISGITMKPNLETLFFMLDRESR